MTQNFISALVFVQVSKMVRFQNSFLVGIGALSYLVSTEVVGQIDSISYLNGTHNQYRLGYSDTRLSVYVYNMSNKLRGKAPNYKVDTLSMRGLSLKELQTDVAEQIQGLLPEEKWGGLPKGHKIGINLAVTNEGIIIEVLGFIIGGRLSLSGVDFEFLEYVLKHNVRLRILKPELYKSIDFMPLIVIVNPIRTKKE